MLVFPLRKHMPHILLLAVAAFFLVLTQASAQSPAIPPAAHSSAELDLTKGKIFGATMGMDETATRKALSASHITRIEKVNYPHYFLLQSRDIPGIIFNFRGGKKLNEIYTNSPQVKLSNGLKWGDPIKKFTKLLGPPSTPHRLPSGVGEELNYPLGRLELGIIYLYAKPEVAQALTLRVRK